MVDQNDSSKLDGFYNFMSLKTRKRKQSRFVMIGEVPAASGTLPEFGQRFAVCDSTFTQQSVKACGQMDCSSIDDFNESTAHLCPTELQHSHHRAGLQSQFTRFTVTILFFFLNHPLLLRFQIKKCKLS